MVVEPYIFDFAIKLIGKLTSCINFNLFCYGSLTISGIIQLEFSKLTISSRSFIFQSKKKNSADWA